jgi:hypothetical protein
MNAKVGSLAVKQEAALKKVGKGSGMRNRESGEAEKRSAAAEREPESYGIPR